MDRVFLPMIRAGRQTAWDMERELLFGLIEGVDEEVARDLANQRIQVIDEGASSEVKGLIDKAFHTRTNGEPLVLRSGFAFLPFDYEPGDITQAEVYFVISAVLHQLRLTARGEHSLMQHGHRRKVISPRCFERFNDGVVQAAILRAATASELDFSISERQSDEMERILDFVFTNAANESGEAAREFALALAIGRLRLNAESTNRLREKHGAGAGDPLLSAFLSLVTF